MMLLIIVLQTVLTGLLQTTQINNATIANATNMSAGVSPGIVNPAAVLEDSTAVEPQTRQIELAASPENESSVAQFSDSTSTPEHAESFASAKGASWMPTVTGFFDVRSVYANASARSGSYSLGQVEIDIEVEPSPRLAIALALAFNNEQATVGVGSAFVDLQPFKVESPADQSNTQTTELHIMAGQFDVPFGIDCRSYASIDRDLVSCPAICATTHGLWNDVGVQVYIETKSADLAAYAVNGFNTAAEIVHQELNLATGDYEDVIEEIDTTPDDAYGLRLAFRPVAKLEIGASAATGLNRSRQSEMLIVGFDGFLDLAYTTLKMEYIYQELNRSIAKEMRSGLYFEAERSFSKVYFVTRLGSVKLGSQSEFNNVVSLGGGYLIGDIAKLRAEYLLDNDNEDMVAIQLAVGF